MPGEEQNQTTLGLPHEASSRHFRVIACDTFEGPFADHLVGEFTDLTDAIRAAKNALEPMTAVYVYDDKGVLQFNQYEAGPTV